MEKFRLPLWVAFIAIIFDQVTKFLIWKFFPYHGGVSVIPGFFELVSVRNTGAAFGMFSNNNAFFIGLASFAVILLLVIIGRGGFPGRFLSISAGLLLGGIAGNLLDRLIYGSVIDFLSFQLGSYVWPAFNIADSCICVSAGLLVYHSFFLSQPKKK